MCAVVPTNNKSVGKDVISNPVGREKITIKIINQSKRRQKMREKGHKTVEK